MLARRVLWIAAVAFSLLPLTALGPPAGAARIPAPVATSASAAAFPHSKHVPGEWLGRDEVPRDCRGCHRYSADPAAEASLPAPEALCSKCHYPTGGRASITTRGTLAETRAKHQGFPTFGHGDHLAMDCKTCHADPGFRGSTPPDDMWVPSGMGWCLKCHDESSKGTAAGRGFEKWIDLANAGDAGRRFARGLNAHPGMRKSGRAVFRHEDHLEADQMTNAGRCGECHQSMEGAGAAIGDAVFKTSDCGACHRDASGASLDVGVEERKTTSLSDLVFQHSDHLSPAARGKGTIGSEGCFACHELGPLSSRDRLLSYPVRKELETYDGCVKCHDADGVVGGKGTTRWGVPDHGDVGHASGDLRKCSECHVVGDFEAPLKTARPGRNVARRRPAVFDITEQVHPHMTGPKDVKDKTCADCHIAEVDKIPSRIRGLAFDHASHLGKDPTPADCLECHTVQSAGDGGMMQTAAPDLGALTYDELSCRECHRGIERADGRLRASDYREVGHPVAIFDHNDHLTGDDEALRSCGECHLAVAPKDRASAGRYFTEPADVMTCIRCHNHADGFEICDGADQTYVNKCVDCHEAHTPGLPTPGRAYPIERPGIAGLTGTQFHPAPEDTKCSVCHRTRAQSVGTRQGVVTCDLSYTGDEIHASGTPDECFACHWGDPQRVMASSPAKLLIGGQLVPNSKLQGRLNASRVRSVLGAETTNYPGGPGR